MTDTLILRRCWVTFMLVAATVMATLSSCGAEPPTSPGASAPASGAAPAAPPTSAATSTAAPEPPGRELERFTAALDQRGLEFGADDSETDTYGRAICGGLDSSVPLEEMVDRIGTRTGLSPNDTGFVIGAASASYCPQHVRRLTAG